MEATGMGMGSNWERYKKNLMEGIDKNWKGTRKKLLEATGEAMGSNWKRTKKELRMN